MMFNFLLSLIYKYHKLKFDEYPLSILYYHHVFPDKNPYHPEDLTSRQFDQQIRFLAKNFNILSLKQAISLLKKKALPAKALVITFDDGYQDNYTIAAPILEKHHCAATFFIATQGVSKGYLWNDVIEQTLRTTTVKGISKNIIGKVINITTEHEKIAAFEQLMMKLKFLNHKNRTEKIAQLSQELNVKDIKQSMMSAKQIADLHQRGFSIGAHTHSHTILSTESNEDSYRELTTNKNNLEEIIGNPIEFLAFPNGLYKRDFNQTHCDLAHQLGFKAAFSTNDGGILNRTKMYAMPRFMPYRKQLNLFALSIAKIAGEHV